MDYQPIVLERSAIPLVPIKIISINGSDTLEGIHAEFCHTQSDDRAQAFMSFMDGSILIAAISLPLDPEVREWACEMCIRNFGQRGEEGWINKVFIYQQ